MKFPVYMHVNKVSGHHSMPINHFHDDTYEVYYLLSGERHYFIKDTTYRISKGDIVFIDKNELHKTGDTGVPNHERILLNFHESFLERFAEPVLFHPFQREIRRLRLNLPEREWVERLLFEMLEEYNEEQPGSELAMQARLASLLLWCDRKLALQERDQAPYEHESPAHKKIKEIVEYINGAYETPISLESVSKLHFISPFHLSRMFKRVTGFSFVEYVNTVRVREAQRLLKETEWTVTKISEAVGYENLGHFGRVFKQLTKTNPLHYRKSAKRADW
ncbi:MAG: AraC family transcriptional regulator [Paenibacillus sp.]|jgi:AraC-like DNA-binding protein|nr:AraC family transcriptional regulator [Paenibacillus sp.]